MKWTKIKFFVTDFNIEYPVLNLIKIYVIVSEMKLEGKWYCHRCMCLCHAFCTKNAYYEVQFTTVISVASLPGGLRVAVTSWRSLWNIHMWGRDWYSAEGPEGSEVQHSLWAGTVTNDIFISMMTFRVIACVSVYLMTFLSCT